MSEANKLKTQALHMATNANMQQSYLQDGKVITDVTKLIEAARKIEDYLKEESK